MPRKELRKKTPIQNSRGKTPWKGGCWSLLQQNRAVILVGEDHQGKWADMPDVLKDIESVVNHINQKQKNTPINLWYEGDGSASFDNFLNWFKFEFQDRISVKCWDPPRSTFNKEELLVLDLFCADAFQTQANLGLGGIYIDKLANSKSLNATKKDITDLVSKSRYAKEYMKILSEQITSSSLKQWYKLAGYDVHEDKSSKLYQINEKVHIVREKFLSGLMKRNNGIYLIGDTHIYHMNRRNFLV